MGHPETMKRSVEWAERSAAHQVFRDRNQEFAAGSGEREVKGSILL